MAGKLPIGSVPAAGRTGFGAPALGRAGASYMRGERSAVFANWWPGLRDSRDDVRASYVRAAARTIDAMHNSGWLAGAVNQSIAAIIGTGLRLAAKPDAQALRWGPTAANEWARAVERRFEAWASTPLECDAAGKNTLAQQCASGLRSHLSHGEIVGLVQWINRPVSQTRTKVKLVPAHWLLQDSDGQNLFQGVRVDRDGMPVKYRMQLGPAGIDNNGPVEIDARDACGRPRVIHIFDGDVGQMRGISPFAPALRLVRQTDQLSDATLTAALIQTIHAATIKSQAPTQDVLAALQSETEQGMTQGLSGGSMADYLTATTGWYSEANIDLYGPGALGKIAHLFPGEELEFLRSEHPNENYEAQSRILLREIARAIGMGYETLTGDYSGATYSSVRMESSVQWPVILWKRLHIAAPLYQVAFEAWLEEDIDSGATPFPGGLDAFVANRAAACRADWRGPPRPQADDLKYAKAVEVLFNLGLMTAEQVCAELGADWEDIFEQLKREADLRQKYGLPDPRAPKQDKLADALATETEGA
ncbi:MAG TPA: phage portal protein [Reyranella sp.]|nr:phage portal protein [Reyranella sp.]